MSQPGNEHKYYHPIYKDVFVNEHGHPFKDGPTHVFSILFKNRVKFYSGERWYFITPENFAYECFYQRKLTDKDRIVLKNKKLIGLDKYAKDNLELVHDFHLTSDLIVHPKYSDYGVKKSGRDYIVYSTFVNDEIAKGKLISLYDKENKKRIRYNMQRFIYECLHGKILTENEFLSDGTVYNKEFAPLIVYRGTTFYRTKNHDIYVEEKRLAAFYVPWERCLKVYDGFINIGTKKKPELVALNM